MNNTLGGINMKLGIIKNKLNIMLLCLIASLAFAYTCSSPTTSGGDDGTTGDDGNGGDNGGNPPKPCSEDPFGSHCFTDTTYDTPRATRITKCLIRANVDDPTCAVALARPNVATWLQSFTTELSATPVAINTFLRGTADGLNLGSNLAPNLITLNFNDVFNDGNMTDGLAFFLGKSQAGIFSGTDLGAPVTGINGTTANWNGFIRTNSSLTTPTAFSLTVGFTGTGGTLDGFIPTSFATLAFDINGEFDAKGVITSNIIRGIYATTVMGCTVTDGGNPNTSPTCVNSADGESIALTLSGIIGAEGAVAVFQGGGALAYAGGFVAKAP